MTPIQLHDKIRSTVLDGYDSVILIRTGDFYESFRSDAVDAAQICGLTLTTRKESGKAPVPMCGFPHYCLETNMEKLFAVGKRIHLAEWRQS